MFKVVIKDETYLKCKNFKQFGKEKNGSFVHTIVFGQNFLGPKQPKPENAIKCVVSVESAQNQEMTHFKGLWDG